MTAPAPMPYHDRAATSGILAALAAPGLFGSRPVSAAARRVEFVATPMVTEPDTGLTVSQRLYLERFMRPCPPEMVTSATHRVTWTDSAGIPNTGHCGPSPLGPLVPIAARETTLALWNEVTDNRDLGARIADLEPGERAALQASTTDHDPVDIFRVGIEATSRALAQHALLAHQTRARTAVEFAGAMRDSGLFMAVATQWFWELQASTYRRGMIPAQLIQRSGAIRYTPRTVATLRAMKSATIAEASAVMRRAMVDEGLTSERAVGKYHDQLDLISRQYALLEPGTIPRCLAAMSHDLDGGRRNILSGVVDRYVETFVAVAMACTIVERDTGSDGAGGAADDERLFVPDMNCKHCTTTIRAVLESMDIAVVSVDLISKEVIAEFRSPRNRHIAMEAIRDSGYNPVDVRPSSDTLR